jgi:hypothetical protein
LEDAVGSDSGGRGGWLLGAGPVIGLVAPKEPSDINGPLLSIVGLDNDNIVGAVDVVDVVEDKFLANAAPYPEQLGLDKGLATQGSAV